MTLQQGKKFIFISYAHKDAKVVLPLIQGLVARNFNVWYDDSIEAGSEWPEYIATNLLASECVIVFMSRNADASHNCRQELTYAIDKRKKMIVVYLEDFQPSPGTEMQLHNLHALYRSHCGSNESLLNQLASENKLQPCLCNTTFAPSKKQIPQTAEKIDILDDPGLTVFSIDTGSRTKPFFAPRSDAVRNKSSFLHYANAKEPPRRFSTIQTTSAAKSRTSSKVTLLTESQQRLRNFHLCANCVLQFLNFFLLWKSFSRFEELSSNWFPLVIHFIAIPVGICLLNRVLLFLASRKLPSLEVDFLASVTLYCWVILLFFITIYGSFHVNFTESFLLNLITSYVALIIPQSFVMMSLEH